MLADADAISPALITCVKPNVTLDVLTGIWERRCDDLGTAPPLTADLASLFRRGTHIKGALELDAPCLSLILRLFAQECNDARLILLAADAMKKRGISLTEEEEAYVEQACKDLARRKESALEAESASASSSEGA
jgi:hypothetical protein